MDATTLALLIIIGIAVLAVFLFFRMFYGTARQHARLHGILAPLGFEKSDDDREGVAHRLAIINERIPKRRLITNLHRNRVLDYTLYVCEYHLMGSGGRTSGGERLVVCLVSTKLNLPRFTIEPLPRQTGWAGRLLQSISAIPIPHLRRVETSIPQFNQRFALYAPEGPCAAGFLPDTIIAHLLSRGDIILDAKGATLVLSSLGIEADKVGHQLHPQKLTELIELAKMLFEGFQN